METGKSVSEADLGFPYYPGSVEVTTSSLTFDSREKKGVVSCRQTDDEPSKVIAYYKSMIQDTSLSTTVDNSGEHQELKGKNSAGAEVGVSANRDKGDTKTTVSVAVVTTKLASK